MKTKNSKANPQAQMAVRCSALFGIVLIRSQKSAAHSVRNCRDGRPCDCPEMYPPNTRNTRKEIHAVREAKPRIHRRQRRKRRCRPLLRSLSFLVFETSGPSRRTPQAQRPGARDATIATATLPPGSLQRMVRRRMIHHLEIDVVSLRARDDRREQHPPFQAAT